MPNLSKNQLNELLKPVVTEIDNRICQASEYITKLPDSMMKKLFNKLLLEAKDEWFWVNVNE